MFATTRLLVLLVLSLFANVLAVETQPGNVSPKFSQLQKRLGNSVSLEKALEKVHLESASPTSLCQPLTSTPQFSFPRDYGVHYSQPLEWWWIMGNSFDLQGNKYGTDIFVIRLDETGLCYAPPTSTSTWIIIVGITDLQNQVKYNFTQVLTGSQVFASDTPLTPFFITGGNFSFVEVLNTNEYILSVHGFDERTGIPLNLYAVIHNNRPPALQGSVPGFDCGGGTCAGYVEQTSMTTQIGFLTIGNFNTFFTGSFYTSHEWLLPSNELVEWEWFMFQLSTPPYWTGFFVHFLTPNGQDCAQIQQPDGMGGYTNTYTPTPVEPIPTAFWTSPDGITYPTQNTVIVPALGVTLNYATYVPDNEYGLQPLVFYEGPSSIVGEINGVPVTGTGSTEVQVIL